MLTNDIFHTGYTLTWTSEEGETTKITKADEFFWEMESTGGRVVWNWLLAFGTITH